MQFDLESLKGLVQVERFLAGSAEAEVTFPDRKALYEYIGRPCGGSTTRA